MKGILNLILGILATVNVGHHLAYCNGQSGHFFGFETPFIPYCVIWTALGIYFFYTFYRMNRKQPKEH